MPVMVLLTDAEAEYEFPNMQLLAVLILIHHL